MISSSAVVERSFIWQVLAPNVKREVARRRCWRIGRRIARSVAEWQMRRHCASDDACVQSGRNSARPRRTDRNGGASTGVDWRLPTRFGCRSLERRTWLAATVGASSAAGPLLRTYCSRFEMRAKDNGHTRSPRTATETEKAMVRHDDRSPPQRSTELYDQLRRLLAHRVRALAR